MNDLMAELHKEFTYHMGQAVQYQTRINVLREQHLAMSKGRIDHCIELVNMQAGTPKVAE